MEIKEERIEKIQGLEQEMQEVRKGLQGKSESGSRGMFLKQQINELGNEETLQSLEQMFAAKLALVRCYQKKLASVQDVYTRKFLLRMIQEEKYQLVSLADLIDMVHREPDMGPYARTKAKMHHQLRSSKGRNLAWGVGLALFGMLLYPAVKEKARRVLAKTLEGAMDIADQAQNMMATMKEDLEDIVSEAQFERLKNIGEAGVSDADLALNSEFEPPQQ